MFLNVYFYDKIIIYSYLSRITCVVCKNLIVKFIKLSFVTKLKIKNNYL